MMSTYKSLWIILTSFPLAEIFYFTFQAVALLPEDMRPGPDLYGFPWEIVICAGIVGALMILLFLYRSYQSVSVVGLAPDSS